MLALKISSLSLPQCVVDSGYNAHSLYLRGNVVACDTELSLVGLAYVAQAALRVFGEFLCHGAGVAGGLFYHCGFKLVELCEFEAGGVLVVGGYCNVHFRETEYRRYKNRSPFPSLFGNNELRHCIYSSDSGTEKCKSRCCFSAYVSRISIRSHHCCNSPSREPAAQRNGRMSYYVRCNYYFAGF